MLPLNNTGSSETLRETTASQFHFTDFLKHLPQHKSHIPTPFLEWFVGFAEGDGSFICTTNKRCIFSISQKEAQILHRIRSQLGFGKVSTYGNASRYTVADKPSVTRLLILFNGNLCLDKTHARFSAWCDWANQSGISSIECKRKLVLSKNTISQTSWLAGFIDAEGCFNAQQIRDPRYSLGYRVRLRFFLDQRNEKQILLLIRGFLGGGSVAIRGKTNAEDSPNAYMWRLGTWSLCAHHKLLAYLQSHPLRSQKRLSSKRFATLYNYITTREVIPWQGKVLARVEKLLGKLCVIEEKK